MCSSASVAASPARLLGTLLWFGHSFGLDNLLDDGQRNLFENRYLPEHWNASGQPLKTIRPEIIRVKSLRIRLIRFLKPFKYPYVRLAGAVI